MKGKERKGKERNGKEMGGIITGGFSTMEEAASRLSDLFRGVAESEVAKF